MEEKFMRTLAALTQIDLLDRPEVEHQLGVSLEAYEQLTIPPSTAYRSKDVGLAPFVEANYETSSRHVWARLTLWLDDARCYSNRIVDDEYDFLNSRFELVDVDKEKRGVYVVNSYPADNGRLIIGYRKTSAGEYCIKYVEIQGNRRRDTTG